MPKVIKFGAITEANGQLQVSDFDFDCEDSTADNFECALLAVIDRLQAELSRHRASKAKQAFVPMMYPAESASAPIDHLKR